VFTEYQKDIFRIFSILNIFTLTSLYEPFGRVIIEAMASYVPVIAFSTGGVPEIIIHGQTGILVEVGNYKQMAQEVVSLARNGERRKRIAALAYERVKSAFTLERTIKEIEKLFCEAVKKNSWIIVSIFSILGIPLLS
jgi:glycosyltransferase involved in cell wall biosynthesis